MRLRVCQVEKERIFQMAVEWEMPSNSFEHKMEIGRVLVFRSGQSQEGKEKENTDIELTIYVNLLCVRVGTYNNVECHTNILRQKPKQNKTKPNKKPSRPKKAVSLDQGRTYIVNVWTTTANVVISIKRPDSWDSYHALNRKTLKNKNLYEK